MLASTPVLGPEAAADEFTIGGTIKSKKTSKYLNIATASTSYKPLVWGDKGDTTAWGLEGDTIITVQGSSYGRRKSMIPSLPTESSGAVRASDVLLIMWCRVKFSRVQGGWRILRFVFADGERCAEWTVVQ